MHLHFYDSKVTRNTLADDIHTFSTDAARVLNPSYLTLRHFNSIDVILSGIEQPGNESVNLIKQTLIKKKDTKQNTK